jgi:hypothetical protein
MFVAHARDRAWAQQENVVHNEEDCAGVEKADYTVGEALFGANAGALIMLNNVALGFSILWSKPVQWNDDV